MMDQLDFELKHILQDWAEQQPLPVNGKTQLLSTAAASREFGNIQTPEPNLSQASDLISWAMVYCVDRRLSMTRIIA